jgi:hypothetical protein
VLEVKVVTAISEDGEQTLPESMNAGVRFRFAGVFTTQIMKQLACRARQKLHQTNK